MGLASRIAVCQRWNIPQREHCVQDSVFPAVGEEGLRLWDLGP